MIPPKLKEGDHVRIIAPSHSISPEFTKEMEAQAIEGLKKLGLSVSFGKYVREIDDFQTTTVEHRLEDLHDAFADPDVQAVIPVRGGSSVSQLLKHINYDLIKDNPKILCGLSDITALSYALYKMTGVVNYYGPHFTMLGASRVADYSFESMKKTLFSDGDVILEPSKYYNNTEYERELILNEGFWTIKEGKAEGKSIAGNLLTTNLTMGSQYMPDMSDSILFLEENFILDYKDVQNELQSILNTPGTDSVRAIILGRFQRKTGMTRELLTKIIKSKKELEHIPVVGNVDIGHTAPMLTIPVGGTVRVEASEGDEIKIEVIEH